MHGFRLYSRAEHVIDHFVIYNISKLRSVVTYIPKEKFKLECFYHCCHYDISFIKKCSWLIFEDLYSGETIPIL